MAKISYSEYLEIIRNPETTDEEIIALTRIEKGAGGFDFQIRPDPKKVELSPSDEEFESAMKIGNGIDRLRRRGKFFNRLEKKPATPVLVAEGDSWFQFPLLVTDTIDHLSKKYAVWCVSAAGDTAQNMVFGQQAAKSTEYMTALRRHRDKVRAFLFSAAGNDIIGEDPQTNVPVILDLLKPFNGDKSDAAGHINHALFAEKIAFLRKAYRQVIDTIRTEPGLETLPIIVHGYDIPFPYPWGKDDRRSPIWAKKDEWLGSAMKKRRINDQALRRKIIKVMIDALYDMLFEIAGNSAETGVWVVDCRGALPRSTDWADEIHGTSEGFATVAARFEAVLRKAARAAPGT